MKKIINKPSDFVEESIEGLVKSHPEIYSFASDNKLSNCARFASTSRQKILD